MRSTLEDRMGKLDGMTVLVTGAGRKRGLGRAIALRAAAEGANVVVSAYPRPTDSLPEHERREGWLGSESVAREIRDVGGLALAHDCDVTRRDQVEALFKAGEARFGIIDGVVNNAGVASEAGAASIAEMDDENWYHTVDVNLNGPYLVSKVAVRALLAAGKPGAIVNISSMAGRVGLPNYGAYCATKFGLIGLTQQLAVEVAKQGIRVNCVCPGSTDTDMMDGTFHRTADRVGAEFSAVKSGVRNVIPMGRQGRPEEQAAATVFLLGPDASFITGQTVNVDGGSRMD
jgi:NAD(P)-dependent dehydrogenase (short-subunit alcohol dehydrogenase family)